MKFAPYRAQFMAYVLAMMADNIEHVISYWDNPPQKSTCRSAQRSETRLVEQCPSP